MKKVKEFLDKYFVPLGETSCEIKKYGHYHVSGDWEFVRNVDIEYDYTKPFPSDYTKISLGINNETILFKSQIVMGINVGKYSYLQTYKHIPRGEPDENGFYERSTEDEVIRYIKSMINIYLRDENINKILE